MEDALKLASNADGPGGQINDRTGQPLKPRQGGAGSGRQQPARPKPAPARKPLRKKKPSAAKPKQPKKPSGGGKPKLTPEERKRQRDEQKVKEHAENRAKIDAELEMGGKLDTLADFADSGKIARTDFGSLQESGLVELDDLGNPRLSKEGAALLKAAESGDIRKARVALSKGVERFNREESETSTKAVEDDDDTDDGEVESEMEDDELDEIAEDDVLFESGEFDDSAKAGARHSGDDIALGRSVKEKAREIVADMNALGFTDPQDIGHPAEESNALKAISETDDEFRAANYIVLFGGRDLEGIGSTRKNADGSRGEFFTKTTKFDSAATKTGKFPIDWEHNTYQGHAIDGVQPGDYFGYVDWKTARVDERGIWVERVLSRRKKYVQWIEALIKQGLIGNSSEAHNIIKGANGEIKVYPLVRDTFTMQPMEPRMMTQNVVTALKALGIETSDVNAEPQATGASSAAEQGGNVQTQTAIKAKGILDMDEKDLIALLDKRDEARKAADAAEAERKSQEQERINAAVKAAEAKFEKEKEALKSQYVAAGRLPMGQAPAQTHFADTKKYDGMGADDLAFMGALLGATKQSGQSAGMSESAIKALAIKVAEDKTEAKDMSGQTVNLGEQGRAGLKALGVDPADVLNAAKANEVNYSTLASYGDEWVGVEYSRRLWPAVRAMTFVLGKLPQVEVPQGVESIIIPLESGDPTFYKVAQTADENATTGTPNATVTSSRLGTARNTLTVAKGGARTQYSGEMEEDSLIPWASQLRAQMEKATAEQLEHAVIDGDTATGATTNINHIGGTPGSTDFYLLVDGLRKSPLVTTTANSRSAAGSLVDTDFLETVYLMGTAGLIGYDPTKVDFIIDPSTHKKALQLASVKTRDVFSGATLEGGRITQIWNYPVNVSFFMHYKASGRLANTAGKVDQTTPGNNLYGAILAVRWDQWLFGWKRRIKIETVRVPRADVTEITATMRFGMLQRDTEGSAETYFVGV